MDLIALLFDLLLYIFDLLGGLDALVALLG